MGTIREKLAYLNNTKSLIRSAIVDKGVAVSSNDTFRSYAEKIGLISGSSSSGSSSLNLGPYAEPTISSFTNTAGSLPEFSTTKPTIPSYTPPEDWWDIESIIKADSEDYPAKMIVLYPASTATISLAGANFYRVSDGTTYTTSGTHTWDINYDKVNSNGVGYRYVIYYYNSANGYKSSSVNSDALAIVTKGFKWSTSGVFSSKSYLQYVKTIDSDWSACTSTNYWFKDCRNLLAVSMDFNNGIAEYEPIYTMEYMFQSCNNLKYLDFSFPAYVNDISLMFYECYDLDEVHLDFSHRDAGAIQLDCEQMWYSAGPAKTILLSLNPEQDLYSYRPWVGIKTDHPIKVSSIAWTNDLGHSSSTTYSTYYTPDYVDIEASNDNKTWTTVGKIDIKVKRCNYTTTTDLNLDTAYQYWRFRAPAEWSNTFGCTKIAFTAQWEKTTTAEDGTETTEWVDWTQPVFTSNSQDDCVITASYSYSSNYAYYAFNNSTSNYWRSDANSSIYGPDHYHSFGMYGSAHYQFDVTDIFYIEGTDKCTGFYAPRLQAKYVIFENTDSFTSMRQAFSNDQNGSNCAMVGCIIPNTSNIKDWTQAFYYCTSLTVAPQIAFADDAKVYNMFSKSAVQDISFLTYSNLKSASGLFAGTDITKLNATFDEAEDLSYLCSSCNKLEKAIISAPKARNFSHAFHLSSYNGSDNSGAMSSKDRNNALKYVKISGYNQESRATVTDTWSGPNLTSDTSYGTVTTDGLTGVNSSNSHPYKIFDGTKTFSISDSSSDWYNHQYVFKGNGTITLTLPDGVTSTISGLTFTSGAYSTSATCTCRIYADTDKTIPLTDEFTISTLNYFEEHTFTLDTPVTTGTIVIDITNSTGYIGISEVTFDATIEASGYMENMSYMFYGAEVVKIDMDTSKATDMSYAFAYAHSLLDLSDFNYDSAVDMNHAFYYNEGLTELNQIEFPVATNLNYCFANCDGLIEVTDFSAPECLTAEYMFSSCVNIGAIIQPNMPKVTDFAYAFSYCYYLKELDLSNIETEVNCEHICQYSYGLAKVKLPAYPTNLYEAFQSCYALRQANLGNTSKVTSMYYCFAACKRLLSISSMDLSSCTNLDYAFLNCEWLETIDITNLDSMVGSSSYRSISYSSSNSPGTTYHGTDWFNGCASLTSVTLPAMPKFQGCQYMFYNCTSLVDVTIGATPACTTLAYAFAGCSSLKNVTIADTSAVTSFHNTFRDCTSLETQPTLDMSSAVCTTSMFYNCKSLKEVSLSLPKSNSGAYMFYNCQALSNVSLTYGLALYSTEYMFYNCKSLTDISFTDDWDMSSMSSSDGLQYMFYGCEGLTSISLDKWTFTESASCAYIVSNNPNLKSFTIDFKSIDHSGSKMCMVANCTALETFNIEGTGNLSNLSYLYAYTPFKTITINLSDFTSSTSMPYLDHLFYNCSNLESVILNYAGKTLSRYTNGADWNTNYTHNHNLFSFCPKLTRIDILNANNIYDWSGTFSSMTNESECTIDWNNSRLYYDSSWVNSFLYNSGAGLTHVNMLTTEANPGYYAFNSNYPEGYCAEPIQTEAQIDLDLPVDIQINKLTFTQRSTAADSYECPSTARFYSDSDCTTPITPAMELETTASSAASVDVADVVTDHITCKFGQDLGRYIGCGQIDISAKAKAQEVWVSWTQPRLTSATSYGTVTSDGNYYTSTAVAWRAFDSVKTTSGSWYFWCPGSTTAWLNWALPEGTKIKVKGLKVRAPYYFENLGSSFYPFCGQFYTDSTKTTRIGDPFVLTTAQQELEITGIPSAGIITSNIYLAKLGGGYYAGIDNIDITAEELGIEYLPWSTETSEWEETEDWTQPTLTANDSNGTVSASSETTDHEAYKATTSDGWTSSDTDADPYWQWVLPNTVHAKSLSFKSDDVRSCQVYSDEGTTTLGSELTQSIVASGFDSSSYFNMPSYPSEVTSFRIETKVKTGSSLNYQGIFGPSATSITTPQIKIDSDTGNYTFCFGLPLSSGSWGTWIYSATVTTNMNYWLIYSWDGSQCKAEISTDGVNYTTLGTVDHASITWSEPMRFGADISGYFQGSIDLTATKIYVNDSLYWSYTDSTVLTTVGSSPTLTYSGFDLPIETPTLSSAVATSFSSSNKLKAFAFNTASVWDLVLHFTTGLDISTEQFIVNHVSRVLFEVNSGYLRVYGYGTGWTNIQAVSANTSYWVKARVDGVNKTVSVYTSSDGVTWTASFENQSNASTYCTDTNYPYMALGAASSEDYPFYGSIDLKNTKIYKNEVLYWEYTGKDSTCIVGSPSIIETYTYSDPVDVSTIRIKPLKREDGTDFGSASVSLNTFLLEGTYEAAKTNLYDFEMPSMTSYSQDGCTVSCTQALKQDYTTSDSSYYSGYTYEGCQPEVIKCPPITGNIGVWYYFFALQSDYSSSEQNIAMYDFDFYAQTKNNAGWINSSWWYTSSSSYLRVYPRVIRGSKNIVNSMNLSLCPYLDHDSLIDLLNALISKVGTTACTLTLGSTNLAKLSDTEKAIATEKNWNLA